MRDIDEDYISRNQLQQGQHPSPPLVKLGEPLFRIERIEAFLPAKFWDDVPVFLDILAIDRSYRAPDNISIICPDCREKRLHACEASSVVL
jgi:hypothetical protein